MLIKFNIYKKNWFLVRFQWDRLLTRTLVVQQSKERFWKKQQNQMQRRLRQRRGSIDPPENKTTATPRQNLGKGSKGKGKMKAKRDDNKDLADDCQTEKRAARVVAEDSLKYSADTVARCPLPGCDSKGEFICVPDVTVVFAINFIYLPKFNRIMLSLWPRGIGTRLGRNRLWAWWRIPGSVGYISYPMFIEPTITWVPSGFSGCIWLDTKIVLNEQVQYLACSVPAYQFWVCIQLRLERSWNGECGPLWDDNGFNKAFECNTRGP